MALKQSKLAWIIVSDINRSQKFFKDTLGLKLENSAPEYGWLEFVGQQGGALLGVGAQNSANPLHIKNAVMTFTVDNIEKSKAELQAKGVKFIDEIQEVPGHVKMVTFLDPDNNMFQLVQEL